MQIKFSIQPKYEDIEIVICHDSMTEEVKRLADTISKTVNQTLMGYTEFGAEMLLLEDIIRIYAQQQKVFAQTKKGIYALHFKLYEVEKMLGESRFVRISKSEIVNVRMIRKLDTSVAGTIQIYLEDDIETYVSRRNVAQIKKVIVRGGGK